MSQPPQDGDVRDALIKIAFGAGALACVLAGLVLYLFAEQLGIDPDTAELIAIAFLIAGIADYLVLRFWDRLMAGRRR
jgi:hypothetical protein